MPPPPARFEPPKEDQTVLVDHANVRSRSSVVRHLYVFFC